MLISETMTLSDRKMAIDLIVFDMINFDVILGIDFLSQCGVKIYYKKKKVQFHLDNSEKFTFDKSHVISMMISSIKARKLLSKGCTSYLT